MAGSRRRGALVLFEGLPPTVIDSQVLTHARLMREELGINLLIVAFACTDAIFARSTQRLEQAQKIAGGPILLRRGVRPAWPGSLLVNRRRLAAALRASGDIAFVHARGDYTAAVAGPLAHRRNVPMLWDCRGDTVAEFRQRTEASGRSARPITALRAALLQRDCGLAARSCSAAMFVSEPLHLLMAPLMGNKAHWVVPCLALEDAFFFDADLRRRQRAALGFADDETVFLYSGSLVGYQRFDQTVELMRGAFTAGRKIRFLVMTPEVAAARSSMSRLPVDRAVCIAAELSEVNAYLNAADFGFLLRDADAINRVAFPTKFAEYSLAGLKIVMKADPPSCVAIAHSLGTYVSADAINDAPIAASAVRARTATVAAQQLGRRAALPVFERIYGSLMRGAQDVRA